MLTQPGHFVALKAHVYYPSNTEAMDQARRDVSFSLNQPEGEEAMLDFTLNQSETEQQFEGEVFRGFSTEECEEEGKHLKLACHQIQKYFFCP